MKKKVKTSQHLIGLQKFKAVLTLLSFFVVIAAGVQAGATLGTIIWRATIVAVAIALLSRVLLQIFVTSEEMNRGEG